VDTCAITVVINSASGRATTTDEARLEELFRKAGLSADVIEVRNAGADLPARCARGGTVVAAGGDGTVSAVAAILAGTPATIGVLPLGTLNHFARDVGIPTDLDKAVGVIAARRIRAIDVGIVNDRVFVNNVSIGVYPSIVEMREQLRRQGHRKWMAMVLAIVRILRHYRGVRVTITVGERRVTHRTPFVLIANNEYSIQGGGLGQRESLAGGRLWVYLAPQIRAWQLPRLVIGSLLGRPSALDDLEILSGPDVRIDIPGTGHVRLAIDGETTMMATPMRCRTSAASLNVLVPAD
jgi:diacylglycerol kinase family enzyme